jgi:glutamyl-tRNA reductase
MNRIMLVGLNHTTAPLAVREKIAFAGEQRVRALAALREKWPEAEGVLVSTCNRVELYVARPVHAHPREEEMADFIAGFHGLRSEEVSGHLYRKNDRAAVNHLFTVASSLDSMVLGETQILGQVREAYEIAQRAGVAGTVLNPLFQRAIAVGKQVMSQTTLNEGRLSIASVAIDYARNIFDHFGDKTILSIGAGKMANLVLQGFGALKPGKLLVCNRSPEKAIALAEQFGGVPAPYEKLSEHLVAADIVISGTGATQAIISRAMFEPIVKQRRYRPIFMIDIALPRDIEAGVEELENVYLYNIDDLQQVVAKTQSQRVGAVDEAKHIVESEVEEFGVWLRTREMGPLIDKLFKRCHTVASAEVSRTVNKFPDISDAERQHLEDLGRRIVNKLLHDPIQTLKGHGAPHGNPLQYLHAMERLFKLGDEMESLEEKREEGP